jgi:hypothetical protein
MKNFEFKGYMKSAMPAEQFIEEYICNKKPMQLILMNFWIV